MTLPLTLTQSQHCLLNPSQPLRYPCSIFLGCHTKHNVYLVNYLYRTVNFFHKKNIECQANESPEDHVLSQGPCSRDGATSGNVVTGMSFQCSARWSSDHPVTQTAAASYSFTHSALIRRVIAPVRPVVAFQVGQCSDSHLVIKH